METKRCSKCGEEKLIGAFSIARKNVDGLNGQCKECVRIWRISHYWAKPEVFRAKRRRQYQVDIDSERKRSRDSKRRTYPQRRHILINRSAGWSRENRALINSRANARNRSRRAALLQLLEDDPEARESWQQERDRAKAAGILKRSAIWDEKRELAGAERDHNREDYQKAYQSWYRPLHADEAYARLQRHLSKELATKAEIELLRIGAIMAEMLIVQDEMSAKSTPELIEFVKNGLGLNPAHLAKVAEALRLLKKRGVDLAVIGSTLTPWLERMADGRLLPELWCNTFTNPRLLAAAAKLEAADQQLVVADTELPVARLGVETYRLCKPSLMNRRTLQLVFADDHIRGVDAQIAILQQAETAQQADAMRPKSPRDRRIKILKSAGIIVIGGVPLTRDDLLRYADQLPAKASLAAAQA